MSVQANCPSCGAGIVFAVGTSLVTVCPYCKSVVGRGDRGVESLGKVADLVETNSPLDLGIKGRYDNVPFDLVGRAQFLHSAGGVWDEWYASFGDGRWGWLAEAQGRFYMTFAVPVPAGLPGYDDLELGQKLQVAEGQTLIVAEKGRAHTGSARGELPYRLIPDEELPFADLSGPRGEFGTVDYSDSAPAIYLGRQVTLDELHIPPGVRRRYPGQEPTVKAVRLNCPQCAGPLDLRAPDQSERVGCPYCGALLDVKEGTLKLLQTLKPPEVQPLIPLGAVGRRDGIDWTVIGFMRRYVTFDKVDYFWDEYLLYQPRLGFRWLTCSDDHWNWVEALPPGVVEVSERGATYAGRWHRLFQKAKAKVSFVIGEFYWKVEAGETVNTRDFVSAPTILSEEVTKEGKGGEINWSIGSYVERSDIAAMFSMPTPPAPSNIAPNQPFPYTDVYRYAFYLIAAVILLGFALWVTSPRREVYRKDYVLRPLPNDKRSVSMIVEEPLDLAGHKNLRVSLRPRAGGGWVHIDGALVPVQNVPVPGQTMPTASTAQRPFAFLAAEGQTAFVYLSSVPAGKYTLHFDMAWQNPMLESGAEVRVEQGVSHPGLFLLTLLILGSVPVVVGLYQLYFESRRWADANTE